VKEIGISVVVVWRRIVPMKTRLLALEYDLNECCKVLRSLQVIARKIDEHEVVVMDAGIHVAVKLTGAVSERSRI
jgi:hypothetical protein